MPEIRIIKHRHFPCEALNQTWTDDSSFQKLKEHAKEHHTRSVSHSEKINKLAQRWLPAAACMITVNCLIDAG